MRSAKPIMVLFGLLIAVSLVTALAGERLTWQTQQGRFQVNITDERAAINNVGFCMSDGDNCPSALSGFGCPAPNATHTFVVNNTAVEQCVAIPTSGAADGNDFLTSVSATNDSGSHTFNFSVSGQPDILVTINDQTSAGGGDPTGVVSVQAVDASLIVVNATTANFSVNTTHLDTFYVDVDGDNITGVINMTDNDIVGVNCLNFSNGASWCGI